MGASGSELRWEALGTKRESSLTLLLARGILASAKVVDVVWSLVIGVGRKKEQNARSCTRVDTNWLARM